MNNDLAGDTRAWLMATVGRGMAIFAQVPLARAEPPYAHTPQQEIRDKLSVNLIRQLKGKLLFVCGIPAHIRLDSPYAALTGPLATYPN